MTATSERDRCLLAVNANAGAVSRALVEDVAERCALNQLVPTVVDAASGAEAVGAIDEAVAEARDAGSPLRAVVAIGGDATVRAAAEGLARGAGRWPAGGDGVAETVLLVVPAGRGNSFFRAIWGGRPWQQLVDGHADERHAIDLARIVELDRAVALGASTGLLADIAHLTQLDSELTGQERYWTAIGTALQRREPYDGRVLVDGTPLHEGATTLVAVGGARRLGAGDFELLPRSRLDDGLLDVLAVEDLSNEELGELAALLPSGSHLDRPGVHYAQGRAVQIERRDGRPLAFAHDGDLCEEAEAGVTLDVVPHAVAVANV